MLTIDILTADLVSAMKAKDTLKTETLRALKTRVQNEQISKGRALEDSELLALVQSECKRRKESAESFRAGGREELASKEEAELAVLQTYLPAQVSESEIVSAIDELLATGTYEAKDMGSLMGQLKAKFGASADGATLSKILKEKLK